MVQVHAGRKIQGIEQRELYLCGSAIGASTLRIVIYHLYISFGHWHNWLARSPDKTEVPSSILGCPTKVMSL